MNKGIDGGSFMIAEFSIGNENQKFRYIKFLWSIF